VAETAGAEAPEVIRRHRPDILFLDVQMPDLDGFGVLRALDLDPMPLIVFVTAYDEFALEAFEVAAIDYLLKPFSDDRFRAALARAKSRRLDPGDGGAADAIRALAERMAVARDAREPTAGRILVRGRGRTTLVPIAEIDWIEARGVYARIHAGERSHLTRESLSELERQLAGSGFFRIHRSSLVNLDRVVELRHRSHGDYTVHLRDGTRLRLSRTRRAALEKALGNALG
jgi:two-component system LytT family response regulator